LEFSSNGLLIRTMGNENTIGSFVELEAIRKKLQKRFAFVKTFDDLPKSLGGSALLHIEVSPKIAFHFLEFIFEVDYVDIMQEAGFRFLDDKTTWEYFLMSENGFLRIYDWKDYTVSVGSFGLSDKGTAKGLEKDAEYLKHLVEGNIEKFDDYRQAHYKKYLDQYPFDNFMNAFVSLGILLNESLEEFEVNRGYLEALMLLVAMIDTELRYAILLTRINVRKTKKVDPDFRELFQQVDNSYITERGIFKLANREIEFPNYDKENFFKRANELYDIRNRAVHRYAITNFQYSESRDAVKKYLDLKDILYEIIVALEKEQVRLGVGFIKENELGWSSKIEKRQELGRVIASKIDSTMVLPRTSEREPMFSDKYPEGFHPSLKETMKEIKKEFKKKRPDSKN